MERPIDQYAANYARNVARTGQGEDYNRLSGRMCWDAVAEVARTAAEAVAGNAQAGAPASRNVNPRTDLVSTFDPRVDTPEAMRNVRPGAVLGFFDDGGQLAHVMIATGNGFAAGNKNDCIRPNSGDRTFAPVGFQDINLADSLNWDRNRGGIGADAGHQPGNASARHLVHYNIHQRPLSDPPPATALPPSQPSTSALPGSVRRWGESPHSEL